MSQQKYSKIEKKLTDVYIFYLSGFILYNSSIYIMQVEYSTSITVIKLG